MDPNATITAMAQAYDAGAYAEARAHSLTLRQWLGRDGFPPFGMPRTVAYAICDAVSLACAALERDRG